MTVVDDAQMDTRAGANVDDEGNRNGRNVLIEDGMLRRYLHDRITARLTTR